jgi:hypothetical protein
MPAPMSIVVDPQFASGDENDIERYNKLEYFRHAGDAAIWTGHYLAAEAFRFAATGRGDARAAVDKALGGIERLVEVTATTSTGQPQKPRLARFYMPDQADDAWTAEYRAGILAHEKASAFFASSFGGKPHLWMGNTSRDQYSGVFFGLGVAYDLIPQASSDNTHERISTVVTKLLDYLLGTGWSVVNPNGTVSTTFTGRADQQLSFLQVGRRVNSAKFDATYKSYRTRSATAVRTPIAIECFDTHGGYYKFNLNHINLYNLIRLEELGTPRNSYVGAFNTLRNCTGTHQNAHFNMIERAIRGANTTREQATAAYLEQWRTRKRRDYPVDNNGKYAACGTNRACAPIPVPDRINTDFLWQRSPFALVGTGAGTIETAAIDYLLSYWMSQYCALGARNLKVCA